MKLSRRWLLDFLPSSAKLGDDKELAALLTGRGIEVESYTAVANAAGLIVGKVLSLQPHPAANQLQVCQVNIGDKAPSAIICGASNVAAGQYVVVAPPGAVVGGNSIVKRDIRGVQSNGMLCSAAEIGIGDDKDGIIIIAADDNFTDNGNHHNNNANDNSADTAVNTFADTAADIIPGRALDDYLQLSDTVFDTAITPNRGDCLSHLGVAREIIGAQAIFPAAALDADLDADIQEQFSVEIEAAAQQACPYYTCIIIRGAIAARPSPWWLKTRLERCGLRSINAAVDITNYVMWACGQPLHAFDLDTLSGGIRVRFARQDDSLTLLNGDTVACRADTLLIADHQKAVAMGGVMGGEKTAVSDKTINILLEGAFFVPAAVRGKTMEYGLTSDAAYRFERGVNPCLPPQAVRMGARLIKQICGGNVGMLSCAGAPPPPSPPITISGDALRGLIGMPNISTPQAADLLSAAGIPARIDDSPIGDASDNGVNGDDNANNDNERDNNNNGIHSATEKMDESANKQADIICVSPPPWRFDLEYPADIAEEVIRLWGYDKLPETAPPGGLNIPPLPPSPYTPAVSRRRFAAMGFAEIITYAFVSPLWEKHLNTGRGAPLQIQNPINQDMSVMRTTLLGGLIDRALFNLNHRQDRLRLFEIGRCFIGGDAEAPWRQTQPLFIAGIALGGTTPTQWATQQRDHDFFDVRGWLEEFLTHDADFCANTPRPPFLHPRQSVNIYTAAQSDKTPDNNNGGRQLLGAAGVLHPQIADIFGFRRPPLVFEFSLEPLMTIRRLPQAQTISRFPLVRRDLSVVAPSDKPAGEVLTCVRRAAKTPICDIDLFDCYESDNITEGKKCYGIRLSMQGTAANLTEADITRALDAVVGALLADGMELRQ